MSVADEISRLNSNISTLSSAKTAIASAITAKGGTVAQGDGLEDFASDIASIPSGSAYDIDDLIDGSITSIESDVTSMKKYIFQNCTNLVTARFPNSTNVGENGFMSCTSLQTLYIPKAKQSSQFFCNGCSALTNVWIPKISQLFVYTFTACKALQKIILPSVTQIEQKVFNCTYAKRGNLKTIVLGANQLVSLNNINSFDYNEFDITYGTGGTVYVPRAQITIEGQSVWLVDAYPNATNWSALNCTFKEIAETTFSGDGSTTTFTLTDNNAHPDDVFYIKIGNDFPDFTYDSTTGVITFVTAPASGTNNINVYFKGVEVS